MSVKVHFAVDHIDDFAPNCGAYSDEQGERTHQAIKTVQTNYKGKKEKVMLADYHYGIRQEGFIHGRQSCGKKLFM